MVRTIEKNWLTPWRYCLREGKVFCGVATVWPSHPRKQAAIYTLGSLELLATIRLDAKCYKKAEKRHLSTHSLDLKLDHVD